VLSKYHISKLLPSFIFGETAPHYIFWKKKKKRELEREGEKTKEREKRKRMKRNGIWWSEEKEKIN
jgi:hypothetical protein